MLSLLENQHVEVPGLAIVYFLDGSACGAAPKNA